MKIETRFDLGDKVFTLYNDRVNEVLITGIMTETTRFECGRTTINYKIQFQAGGETKLGESKLFATKDELLKTL